MSQQPGHIAAVSAFSLALVGDKDIVCRVCLSSCFLSIFLLEVLLSTTLFTELTGPMKGNADMF